MFILEKLPKESVQASDEQTGKSMLFTRSITVELNDRLKLPWTPSFCMNNSTRWIAPTSWNIEVNREDGVYLASNSNAVCYNRAQLVNMSFIPRMFSLQ